MLPVGGCRMPAAETKTKLLRAGRLGRRDQSHRWPATSTRWKSAAVSLPAQRARDDRDRRDHRLDPRAPRVRATRGRESRRVVGLHAEARPGRRSAPTAAGRERRPAPRPPADRWTTRPPKFPRSPADQDHATPAAISCSQITAWSTISTPSFSALAVLRRADVGAADQHVGVGRDRRGGRRARLLAQALEGRARDLLAAARVRDRAGDDDGLAGQRRVGGDLAAGGPRRARRG